MKIKQDLKPWEVMKAAAEGAKVAYKYLPTDEWEYNKTPAWNWQSFNYTIIDSPVINWPDFNWAFFNEYGGLLVVNQNGENGWLKEVPRKDVYAITESPPYPWFGNHSPVPENVEVVVYFRSHHSYKKAAAGELIWEHRDMASDIIAFAITGVVL